MCIYYCAVSFLLHVKIEHFFVENVTFQPVANAHSAYSGRSTRKEYVANFQCKKTAHVSNQCIYFKNHVG